MSFFYFVSYYHEKTDLLSAGLSAGIICTKNYQKQLDNYMNAEAAIKEFNGSVMVVQKGKTIYQKAFGLADRE